MACNKVNLRRIETHWPDMLRVAGSLITNQVRAYDLPRMFGREGHPTPLGAAFAQYGRIDKTMHLLAVVDPVDDTYRRLMNRQLTVRESRHRLARAICHGGRGQIRQAYREGQEDQLAALGLVLNAVALWNTRYLDATVAQLRAEGLDIKDEDIARLSPLKDRHINFMGRYLFNIKASGPGQGLRPLRDPDPAEAMWATTEPARYLQWRRGTYQPELSERWFGEAVAVPGGCGRFAHRLLEDSYSVFDAAEVDETLGTERAAESRVPFEDCGGFLSAASFGKHVGQDPGRVPGVALGVRPRLLDRLIEQAAVGHERKPHPEEVPVLLAVAATPESIKVGQAVPGPVMVGVQGAKSVDDPVLRTVLGERAHHLDRLVAPSVPDQELGQRYSHMPHAVRRSTECAVGGDRAFHVAAFLQHFGKALRGVPVMLGSCVRTQFRDPVVPGQQVRQLVTAVDRSGLAGVQQGDRLLDSALAFPDRGEQVDCVGRFHMEVVAVGVVASGDRPFYPDLQQGRRFLIHVGRFGDVDQTLGEEPVLDPVTQQHECLTAAVVAGQQAREEDQRQPVTGLRVRAGQRDRFLHPAPALQQLRPGLGRGPPVRGDVRSEHLQCLLALALMPEQPCPLQRAEPLPATGLELHFPLMTEFEKPRHQQRRNAARQRSGPVVEISSVHDSAP